MSFFRRKSRLPEQNPFCIAVSSPKFKEFANKYLDNDGAIRPEIYHRIWKISGVKDLQIAYDQENRRWGFDIIASQVQNVAKDPYIACLPCRIIPARLSLGKVV